MNPNYEFYKMQFEMIRKDTTYQHMDLAYAETRIDEIIDITQCKAKYALELGSGMGFEAISLNLKGVNVDAVEISEDLNQFSKKIQSEYGSHVNFITADFFSFRPERSYDLIYYLDGFGVSSHDDQIKLLKGITEWLNENGVCIIEVYNPIYWEKVDGVTMKISDNIERVYGFNRVTKELLDTWTSSEKDVKSTQTLKCYSLQEITDMIDLSGLMIESVHPGGAMDFEKWEYQPKVSLEECLNYKVVLRKRPLK